MYVIKGNTAIFKCIVPSFVADYVSIVSWEDTFGNKYSISPNEHFGILISVIVDSLYIMESNTISLYFPSCIFVVFDIVETLIKYILHWKCVDVLFFEF